MQNGTPTAHGFQLAGGEHRIDPRYDVGQAIDAAPAGLRYEGRDAHGWHRLVVPTTPRNPDGTTKVPTQLVAEYRREDPAATTADLILRLISDTDERTWRPGQLTYALGGVEHHAAVHAGLAELVKLRLIDTDGDRTYWNLRNPG